MEAVHGTATSSRDREKSQLNANVLAEIDFNDIQSHFILICALVSYSLAMIFSVIFRSPHRNAGFQLGPVMYSIYRNELSGIPEELHRRLWLAR